MRVDDMVAEDVAGVGVETTDVVVAAATAVVAEGVHGWQIAWAWLVSASNTSTATPVDRKGGEEKGDDKRKEKKRGNKKRRKTGHDWTYGEDTVRSQRLDIYDLTI